MLICPICNKEFTQLQKSQKYCSKECYKLFHKINRQSDEGKKANRRAYIKYSRSDKGKKNIKIYAQSDTRKKSEKKRQQSLLRKEYLKKYYQTDNFKTSLKKYRQSDRGKDIIKKYEQSDEGKKARKRYIKSDKGKISKRLDANKRRLNIESATPKWNKDNLVKQIYEYALYAQQETGVKMEVDHIVPIKGICEGNKVCGLNVWYNLTVIPKKINTRKYNDCMESNELALLPRPENWMYYLTEKVEYIIQEVKNPEHFDGYLKTWYKLVEGLKTKKEEQRINILMKLLNDKEKVKKYLIFAKKYNFDPRKMLMFSPLAY